MYAIKYLYIHHITPIVSLMPSVSTNFARQGVATQSSTHRRGAAEHAIDGNDDGNFRHGSCSCTKRQRSPWWKVTFTKLMSVREVIITSNDMFGGYRVNYYSISKDYFNIIGDDYILCI